jgi:hypothetical protein
MGRDGPFDRQRRRRQVEGGREPGRGLGGTLGEGAGRAGAAGWRRPDHGGDVVDGQAEAAEAPAQAAMEVKEAKMYPCRSGDADGRAHVD